MEYTATASSGESVTFALETLPQAFATIPDPRRKQGRRYSVAAILSLAVVAVLANHTSVLAMAEWAARQTRHVRRALGFERDTTPHQTTTPLCHVLCPDKVEDRPGLAQGVLEQERDGREGYRRGRAGDVFLGGEIEEIQAQLFLGDLVG